MLKKEHPGMIAKRKYNLTYKARRQGVIINTKRRYVYFTDQDINTLVRNPHALSLIREYDYALKRNQQLKLF